MFASSASSMYLTLSEGFAFWSFASADIASWLPAYTLSARITAWTRLVVGFASSSLDSSSQNSRASRFTVSSVSPTASTVSASVLPCVRCMRIALRFMVVTPDTADLVRCFTCFFLRLVCDFLLTFGLAASGSEISSLEPSFLTSNPFISTSI